MGTMGSSELVSRLRNLLSPVGSRVAAALLASVLAALAVLAVVGSSSAAIAGGAGGAGGPQVVQVKGSDTIGGKLGQDLARRYMALHPDTEIRWEALGSGTAFVGLLDGSAQLGASSRTVKENEVTEARRLGVELRELVIGYDGIAVIVHADNPLASLTLAQLSDLFTGRIRNWQEVGGADLLVHPIIRPSYSGTFSFFRDKVLRHGNDKGGEDYYANSEVIEENGGILQRVAAERGAISYVGIGWITPAVKTLGVAARSGQAPIRPSVESVRTGTYPIYRPLLMYSRGEPHGAARGLLAFILGAEGQKLVAKNDFVPADSPMTLPAETAPTTQAVAAGAATGQATAATGPRTFHLRFPRGATLSAAAREELAGLAATAKSGSQHLLIVGHADASGNPAANHALSLARAQAVASYLQHLGVPAAAIQVEGHGADDPVSSNQGVVGRAANRRVDVTLLGPSKPII